MPRSPPTGSPRPRRSGRRWGDDIRRSYPFAGKTKAVSDDPTELILNRTWRPQLAVTAMDGLPPPANAGNVQLPFTTAGLSLRLPPALDADAASALLEKLLTKDIPYGAEVTLKTRAANGGWNAPSLAPWLEKSLAAASQAAFGKPPAYRARGGSIPFMGMLGENSPMRSSSSPACWGRIRTPMGRTSFLHIPSAKRVTTAVAHVLAEHCRS